MCEELIIRTNVGAVRSGGSPVSLDALREAARAGDEGSKSQVRKTFYTNVPTECFEHMEQSAVQLMGLEFDSSKEHYHVKVCTSSNGRVILVFCLFRLVNHFNGPLNV
jgi:hypothetical protein